MFDQREQQVTGTQVNTHLLSAISGYWISVTFTLPPTQEPVIITDGVNISRASYYRRVRVANKELGPQWVNQAVESVTGGYVNNPTHWMPVEVFQYILLGKL